MEFSAGVEEEFPDCGSVAVSFDGVETHVISGTIDDEVAEPGLSLEEGGVVALSWIQLI